MSALLIRTDGPSGPQLQGSGAKPQLGTGTESLKGCAFDEKMTARSVKLKNTIFSLIFRPKVVFYKLALSKA